MKKFLLILLCFSVALTGIFAQSIPQVSDYINIDKLGAGLDQFTYDLLKTAPNTVTQQYIYPDAYIGQLLSVPPNVAGGVSAGAAQLNAAGLASALKDGLKNDLLKDIPYLYLPTLVLDARVGGILLPFDVGLHGMIISEPLSFSAKGTKFLADYGTIGANIRIPLLKQNVALPGISIGAGFSYSKGAIGMNTSGDVISHISAGYESMILDASLQVSKEILFITPYVGARATLSASKRHWNCDYEIGALKDVTEDWKSSRSYADEQWSSWEINSENPNYTAQIFGGVGIDFLFIVQLGVNASYDLVNNLWAGSVNLRVKL